jgi:hypothetical protein
LTFCAQAIGLHEQVVAAFGNGDFAESPLCKLLFEGHCEGRDGFFRIDEHCRHIEVL